MATLSMEPSGFACGLRSFVPDPSRRAAYQLYYDRWLEVGAARQRLTSSPNRTR